MSLVRSAGLQKFRQCVEGLGGDADGYAAQAGLPVEALDTDEVLVEDRAIAAVLEIAAADLRCADLGLRVGEAQDFRMLGPLSVAIQNSTSVSEALECTSRFMFIHARDLSVSLIDDPDRARGVVAVRYCFGSGIRQLPQATDMTMVFFHRALRFLIGGDYGLRSVDLPHQPVASRDRYHSVFGASVRFARPAALLRVPKSLLSRRLDGVDNTLRALALAFLSRQARQPGPVMAGRVRGVLDQALGTGPTELDDVAKVLAVHPRTLQRQLKAEDQSFAHILDDVRRGRAHTYLTTTDMPLSQIAHLIGLSEQAVLTRCAQRWWGRTPSAVRREA
ncbi:AraC family transcriptional regulator [Mycolicibacterium sp. HK-90]|uniref:AraC family transcriptional regulator n=1 Tax=Mycolicibacterium sp. HK-90 TaxID=3056937 RepID=UPI002657B6FA|nr:AraC family transcriptional regulator [Mycolicibacterium sp. HK-90]WKG04030.1 AraC family transcriptional regulator [Mycolicibacterium sp. HK-90]